ncbi:MAG: SDR family NAD(P)-dependent oxidoreductase [Acidobacteria bacterium]|nr:SDR family NAD(P)-dependent oxidoreductase [Acidobacteriota bacterium]
MQTDLRDKVCIVTGASSGIGEATARALVKEAARIALVARSAARLENLQRELGPNSAAIPCDVRLEESIKRMVETTALQFGSIDILINSAGLGHQAPVAATSIEQWDETLETNLRGMFLACRETLPYFKKEGGGQIINIASGAGYNGIANMAAYCASKFGVVGFSESLALEVRDQNIRVCCLAPGSVRTHFGDEPAEKKKSYSLFPEEVAQVILSLLKQPMQVWMSEVVLRPLNLKLER